MPAPPAAELAEELEREVATLLEDATQHCLDARRLGGREAAGRIVSISSSSGASATAAQSATLS